MDAFSLFLSPPSVIRGRTRRGKALSPSSRAQPRDLAGLGKIPRLRFAPLGMTAATLPSVQLIRLDQHDLRIFDRLDLDLDLVDHGDAVAGVGGDGFAVAAGHLDPALGGHEI